MKCSEMQELMPDLAAGHSPATPELNEHLRTCTGCASTLEGFRQTMGLLDQWQVPEPSQYFDVRLNARLREEAAQPAGWLQWLRRPALAVSLAVVMAAGVTMYRNGNGANVGAPNMIASGPQMSAEPGSAVGDLQALDKNNDLYSDFDELDDLQVQQDVSANP